MDCRLTILQVH